MAVLQRRIVSMKIFVFEFNCNLWASKVYDNSRKCISFDGNDVEEIRPSVTSFRGQDICEKGENVMNVEKPGSDDSECGIPKSP